MIDQVQHFNGLRDVDGDLVMLCAKLFCRGACLFLLVVEFNVLALEHHGKSLYRLA